MRAVAGAVLLVGMVAIRQSEGGWGLLTGVCIALGLLLILVAFFEGGES